MIWTLANPLALLLLPPLVILTWYLWRGRGVNPAAWLLRLVMIALLVGAAADPRRLQPVPPGEAVIMVVDQSASLGPVGQATLRGWAEEAQASGNSGLRTILFADRTLVLPPGAPLANLTFDLGSEGSQVGAALLEAAAIVPEGGRVVLLSDGGATDEMALSEALEILGQRGIPLDVWPVGSEATFDVGLTTLDVPPVVRQGEAYEVGVVATASAPARAQLRLWRDTQLLAEEQVELTAGANQFSFTDAIAATSPLGLAGVRAQVVVQGDMQPANDQLDAATTIAPTARLLLVGSDLRVASGLRSALETQGFRIDWLRPEVMPADPDRLAETFDAIWLLDVNANSLSTAQMSALESFVRDLGRGLLVSGGRQSFALGDYANTPLEAALPVRAEPPPRAERRGVTMLLIVDHSASMESPDNMADLMIPGPTKLEMAKQAAALAVQNLGPDDRVAVLQFDSSAAWVVNFQPVGAGLQSEAIVRAINGITSGGGTNIPLALATGMAELVLQPPGARHVILLTDGRSAGAIEQDYRDLVTLAREAGITLSTIAIGTGADTELLRRLAEWGQGRYAFASTPTEIPELTIRESELLRAESVQEGDFRAELSAAHPTMRGFRPNALPMLEGYVATTPRPQAETVLVSPSRDPLLAAWQYGLGRSVVWTPDVGGVWTREWGDWSEAGRFWANLARYTLPDPLVGPLALRVDLSGDLATIEADVLDPDGTPINRAGSPGGPALEVSIATATTTGEGERTPLRLRQVAPGRYRTTVRLPEAGLYRVAATLAESERSAAAAIVKPYSPEYRPLTDGTARLLAMAERAGGQVLASPAEALPGPEVAPPPPIRLAPWLIAAALLLWPLEIAIRRGWFSRR